MKPNHASEILPVAAGHSVFDPQRWGLPVEAVDDLAKRLHTTWQDYRACFTTRRHDTSQYAFSYLKGIMLLNTGRNYANIARNVISPDSDGQNLQNFMSDSPWSGNAVFNRIQCDIRGDERLHGGMLTLDESGTVRSGDKSAGAAYQYIGNAGKTALGQVGVTLGYYAADVWAMVDAELFLPKVWFDEAHKKLHRQLHIPNDREFKTKLEIGLELIDRARASGLPFSRFSCDALYGQSHEFRAALNSQDILYVADIPSDLQVYLKEPEVGIPRKRKGAKGRPPTKWKVLNGVIPVEVREIAQLPEVKFRTIKIRSCERGQLCYPCAKRSVWTITTEGEVRRETLLMRQESDGDITYSLSNLPENTPLKVLAQWRSERYFAERIYQDAKSECGWDEFMAQKYRAWIHHTALDALALWFVAQTKLQWREKYPTDSKLLDELELDKLPAISIANIRLLLQAVMPLKQFSVDQAIQVVIQHLVNRSASTRSRLRKPRRKRIRKRPAKPT